MLFYVILSIGKNGENFNESPNFISRFSWVQSYVTQTHLNQIIILMGGG
jgi:hypothetical protein